MLMRHTLAGLVSLVAFPAVAAPLPAGPVARLGDSAFRTAGSGIVLSPDGKRAAVHVRDGIDVLDLETGEVVTRLRDAVKLTHTKRTREPHRVSYAFAADGAEIVTSAGATHLSVWDANTGQLLKTIAGPDGKDGQPTTIGLIFNCQLGDFLIAETGAGGLQKFHIADARWTRIDGGYSRTSQVSPNGDWVTKYTDAASIENYVSLVDTKTGGAVFEGESAGDYPFDQAPSPDGKFVACVEAGVQVWDVSTKKEMPLERAKEARGSPRFAPDGTTLIVADPGQRDDDASSFFARWDVTTGKRLADWKMPARTSSWAVDYANNRIVAIAGSNVFRIDIASGKMTPPPSGFRGHVRGAIAPDGKLAAVGDAAGVIRVWPAPFDGTPKSLRSRGSAVDDLVFSHDGTKLFAAYADRTVGVWHTASGKEAVTLTAPVEPARDLPWYRRQLLAISPDAKTLAAVVPRERIWAWDVKSGKVLWEVRPNDRGNNISGCRPVFSPDGESLYCGGPNATVTKFDPRTGAELERREVPAVPRADVSFLAASPDSGKLAVHVYHSTVGLVVYDWNGKRATNPVGFGYADAVGGVAFTTDGSSVVTIHLDGTLRGRRADDPTRVTFSLQGPAGYVQDLQLSADGKLAISDSPDATAVVWKLPSR